MEPTGISQKLHIQKKLVGLWDQIKDYDNDALETYAFDERFLESLPIKFEPFTMNEEGTSTFQPCFSQPFPLDVLAKHPIEPDQCDDPDELKQDPGEEGFNRRAWETNPRNSNTTSPIRPYYPHEIANNLVVQAYSMGRAKMPDDTYWLGALANWDIARLVIFTQF